MDAQNKWIEVASRILKNPFSKEKCPHCNKGTLTICIVPWAGNSNKVDVHLHCDDCGSKNVITKNI